MGASLEIPIIDLFAGPGGLGEGFSCLRSPDSTRAFRIRLSVEMDRHAHQTLLLRSFFRQFDDGEVPSAYYEYLRGEPRWSGTGVDNLLDEFPKEARRAKSEAWCEQLRPEMSDAVDDRVASALAKPRKRKDWVLIGGPPCQAYSLVGRARMKRPMGQRFYDDHRHTLYREYLRIIARHRPSVFVMENVKGLLSATTKDGDLIFGQILRDLENPPDSGLHYRLLQLAGSTDSLLETASEGADVRDFIVRSEAQGLPQARHRVIIVGVLQNRFGPNIQLPRRLANGAGLTSCREVLDGMPRLRSGLSRGLDDPSVWQKTLRAVDGETWLRKLPGIGQADVADRIRSAIAGLRTPRAGRGGRFVGSAREPAFASWWYTDPRLGGVCNHESRGHRADDLHRYLYVSCFGSAQGRSPKLDDFPDDLLPRHRNVRTALTSSMFNDRFRVLITDRPSTTITSHISKDGHAFIHYDPSQCRSLTVREAARLQTFPDNYFFEGPRTEQYHQVGNAVPPLLAREIASVVAEGITCGWK